MLLKMLQMFKETIITNKSNKEISTILLNESNKEFSNIITNKSNKEYKTISIDTYNVGLYSTNINYNLIFNL